MELVEEHRKGNCVERLMRASARTYLISPEVLGKPGTPALEQRDRFSAVYLVVLAAARVIGDLAVLGVRAARAGKRLVTLTLEFEMTFRSAEDRAAFVEEAAELYLWAAIGWRSLMVSEQNRKNRMLMITRTLGWPAIVLSVIILFVFAAIRLADMTQDPSPTDAFGVRYVQHPWVALLHMVPGLLFLALAPLQFAARIRQRRIDLHRRLGRMLVTCAAISGLFALIAAFRLPAFGGISTQAATVFFGAIFLFSLTKAFRHIRRKEVRLHREWMIRTFALATGVASIGVFIALFTALSDLGFEEVFGTSFWLGLGVNLLVAEVWINHTRTEPSTVEMLRKLQTRRETTRKGEGSES